MRTLENIFSFLLCSQLYLEHLKDCLIHKLNDCKQEDTHYLVLPIHRSIYQALNICICLIIIISSVQFSRSVVSDSLWPHEPQHARPPCPSPTPGAYSNSYPLSWWYYPTTSTSVIPFSTCLQSFLASGSFQMSQLFASGGQSIGVSASTSVFPMYIQDWLPLGWTGWISLQSKGLSRVFSNTIAQKHKFFSSQLSV